MPNKMFVRHAEVLIGGRSYAYPNYDIEFDIPHTVGRKVDIAEIKIYNLSGQHRIKRNDDVVVNAGYNEDVGTIFVGSVQEVLPEWSGVDKVTTILCATIGSSFRYKSVNKTYKAGVTASFIIQDLARMIGVSIGELSPVRDISYPKGKVIKGNVYKNIEKVARETQSKMYINHRQVFIRPDKKAGKSGNVINAATGMIGTPVMEVKEEKGKTVVEYKITSLLNHKVQKDTWIRVQSKSINGQYKVREINHKNFTTIITIRA